MPGKTDIRSFTNFYVRRAWWCGLRRPWYWARIPVWPVLGLAACPKGIRAWLPVERAENWSFPGNRRRSRPSRDRDVWIPPHPFRRLSSRLMPGADAVCWCCLPVSEYWLIPKFRVQECVSTIFETRRFSSLTAAKSENALIRVQNNGHSLTPSAV